MLETLPRLRNSVAAWVTWIESMSCPFIKWADSNGRNSNSTTRSTTLSLQLAKRLNKLARGFGLRGSKFIDHGIASGSVGEGWPRACAWRLIIIMCLAANHNKDISLT